MDIGKCWALKADLLLQEGPPYVSVTKFFDGNDDILSLGVNVRPHPGLSEFQTTLESLLARPGIEGVWALVDDIDPFGDSWPYSDMVLVAGQITLRDLREAVENLLPDDVSKVGKSKLPPELAKHTCPMYTIWWD